MADYSEEIAELKAKIADLERRQAEDASKRNLIDESTPTSNINDYNPNLVHREEYKSFSSFEDKAEERRFANAMNNMIQQYRLGKIPKINQAERQLLEYCNSMDMREFLREEFTKHPITLNPDGSLKYSWYREHRDELAQKMNGGYH